jgi:putative transposase
MSYISSIFHVVISTYRRERTISDESRKELYFYIWGIIKNKHCKLIRMNGMPDHIHILLEINPTVNLSDLIRDIKRSSSIWIKQNNVMPSFKKWSHEYAAFSCSFEAKERVKSYIINQQEHHKKEAFECEFNRLVEEHGLTLYHPKG